MDRAEIFQNSMSVGVAIVVVIFTSITIFIAILAKRKRNYKLPPLNKHGVFETIANMADKRAPFFLLDNMRELGTIYRINMPILVPWVICCDPILARQILMQFDEKPQLYKNFEKISKSLFTLKTHGEGWDLHRKEIAKSFSMTNLRQAMPRIFKKLSEVVHVLNECSIKKTSINIDVVGTCLTMDFLTTSMFGIDYRTIYPDSEGRSLQHNIDLVLREFGLKQVMSPFRQFFIWDSELIEATKARKIVIESQMKTLRDYRASKTAAEIEEDMSILGHLIRCPHATEEEKAGDLVGYLIAGHETTGYTLSWIIVEISRNPKVFDKIKEEIDRVIASDVTEITFEHTAQLTYLEMVIKEGMRLWPVAATGAVRELTENVTLGNYELPKGSWVHIPHYPLFRFGISDPDKFIPERWEPDAPEAEKLKDMSFPFSLGKRNCVGQNLAMVELRVVLATLLRQFRFTLESDTVDCDFFLTLKPKNVKIFTHSVL